MRDHSKTGSNVIATSWVSAALIASAIEPLVVKIGYKADATPFQFLALKLLFGVMFISPLFRKIRWIGFDGISRVIFPSILFILTYVFMFFALTSITAVVLVTIITTTPAVVALINQVRGQEQLGVKFWFGFVICFLGVLLTIDLFNSSTGSIDALGILLAIGSVITSALYRTRMDKVTKELTPIVASSYLFIINALIASTFVPWMGEVSFSTIKLSVWIGFAGAIANIAFLSALSILGSTRMSILTVLQRPLVIVAAAVFLKEPLVFSQVAGIALVLLGVHLAKVVKKPSIIPIETLSTLPPVQKEEQLTQRSLGR